MKYKLIKRTAIRGMIFSQRLEMLELLFNFQSGLYEIKIDCYTRWIGRWDLMAKQWETYAGTKVPVKGPCGR
jgi:hypothetical protein